jgi:DNA-binding transcriptional MerR regulator
MRIGEIADSTGVPTKTIRFWEAEGLLPPPSRTTSGYRDYQPTATDRIRFIRHAQGAGLRLDEIRQVLDVSDAGQPPCEHVQAVVHQRLADIDARIAELTDARRVLHEVAARAAAQDPADCHGYCSILTDQTAS